MASRKNKHAHRQAVMQRKAANAKALTPGNGSTEKTTPESNNQARNQRSLPTSVEPSARAADSGILQPTETHQIKASSAKVEQPDINAAITQDYEADPAYQALQRSLKLLSRRMDVIEGKYAEDPTYEPTRQEAQAMREINRISIFILRLKEKAAERQTKQAHQTSCQNETSETAYHETLVKAMRASNQALACIRAHQKARARATEKGNLNIRHGLMNSSFEEIEEPTSFGSSSLQVSGTTI